MIFYFGKQHNISLISSDYKKYYYMNIFQMFNSLIWFKNSTQKFC